MMSISCTGSAQVAACCAEDEVVVPAPTEMLREVVRRYGTPTYAYDLGKIRGQIAKLKEAVSPSAEVMYSLKANASLGLCGFIAGLGIGADVASAGEMVTAIEAGFRPERILVTGPDKSPSMLEQLRSHPEILVSLDSA